MKIAKTKHRHKIKFDHIIKAILIYFSTQTEMTDESKPLIQSIMLSGKDGNKDRDIMEFNTDDILDFEIFGIKIYILPLCKEFSDWERIYETFRNPDNVLKKLSSSGINFKIISRIAGNIYLKMNFYEPLSEPSDYYTNICAINLNIGRMVSGMFGKAFGESNKKKIPND
jgi:hypothetical protein